MVALLGFEHVINAKFIAFAQKLVGRYPSADMCEPDSDEARDAPWPSSPVNDTKGLKRAVYVLGLPDENRERVLRYTVDAATSLGLTVLDEQLGMVFLPSGQVLPAERKELWAGFKSDLDAMGAPAKRVAKAEVRKMMTIFINNVLEPHGFKARKSKRVDMEFIRSTDNGYQSVEMEIRGASPYFECQITCRGVDESTISIVKEVLNDIYLGATFQFELGFFVQNSNFSLPISSTVEIQFLLSLLKHKALPMLDSSRDIKGIDFLLNDAQSEPYRSYFRSVSFNPIVVAWLARNPRFETVVEYARKHTVGAGMFTIKHLDKLLAYLREHVKPVV